MPGPAQEKVTPPVDEDPVRILVVFVHVKTCAAPAFAFGGVIFCVTLTVAVAVQPFAGLVTVNVYVPGAFTVGVGVAPPETIPGPAHEKVTPPVEDDPFNPTLVIEQFNNWATPALAFGGVTV